MRFGDWRARSRARRWRVAPRGICFVVGNFESEALLMDRRRRVEWLGVATRVVGDVQALAVHALRHVGAGAGVVNGKAAPIIERLPPASLRSVDIIGEESTSLPESTH